MPLLSVDVIHCILPQDTDVIDLGQKQLSNPRCNSKWHGHTMKVVYIFTHVQDAND